MPTITADDTYVELIIFDVDDANGQLLLLDGLIAQVNGWVMNIPGFVSSSFHFSHDGKKLFNYAQWRSRAAWENFGSDKRRDLIRDAVKVAGARHLSGQGYAVACVVEAAI